MRNISVINLIQEVYQQAFFSKNKSFTLIEIIIAILIISIGVFSVMALSGKSYASISLQKNKLIAVNLAREEIDIIRSIRDENWLTTEGCDGTDNFCVPPNPEKRSEESDLDAAGIPTGNCDWRCGIGEDILDIDYRIGDPDYAGDSTITWTNSNPGNCIVDGIGCPIDICPQTRARCPLLIDADGYYQHNGNPDTPTFYRSAVIDHIALNGDLNGDGNDHNDFSIISTVCWQERGGRWHGVCIEEHLYNWAH